MCGDSIDRLSQALCPDVSDADVADVAEATAAVGSQGAGQAATRAPLADEPVTTVFQGQVLTMVGARYSPVEAFAVRGDTVVATGSVDDVLAAIEAKADGRGVQIVDYGGQVIMPGFVEPHVHLLMTALTADRRCYVDLTFPGVRTQQDALDKLREAVDTEDGHDGDAAAAHAVRWIAGYGFDPSLVADHPHLTRGQLDAISRVGDSPPVALYVMNQSGHVAYVNSAALCDLGVGIHPGEPGYPADDEKYEKDDAGALTGVLFEDAVGAAGAKLRRPSPAQVRDGARAVLRAWAAQGITTAFDCGVGIVGGMADVALLRAVLDVRRGEDGGVNAVLPRLHGALTLTTVEKAGKADKAEGLSGLPPPPWPLTVDGDLSRGSIYGVKLWLDGSTQGFTAALYEPYRGQPANRGILNFRQGAGLDAPPDDDRLVALARPLVRAGWQLVMHANGARALDQALRVHARLRGAEPQLRPARGMHRLEHVTADVTPGQLARAAQLGLGVSHLIAHVRRWGDAFARWVLDDARAARLDPAADAAAAGVVYSFHSDAPISAACPLQHAETAAARVVAATGAVLGPAQRLSVEQALAGITCLPARQLGRADEVGTLAPGTKADFVVLGGPVADPRAVADARRLVASVSVRETWIGGQVAYVDRGEGGAQ